MIKNILSANWSLSLDLNGGRIKELSYKGVKVFGTYHRVDGKIGNTHICAPSFDKEGQEKYNLPFHGYARTLIWNDKQLSANTIEIKTITPSTKTYQAQLELSQRFTLNETFKHVVEVKNINGPEVPVNVGIHYYWDTPKGWDGSTLNFERLTPLIKTNGYLDLKDESIITFPHAKYTITTMGLYSVMLWTSFVSGEDGNKTYSNDFCCIEPIIKWPQYFDSDRSILHPGETVSASIEIKKVV
jgi:galactose mutarotase-like enzyme